MTDREHRADEQVVIQLVEPPFVPRGVVQDIEAPPQRCDAYQFPDVNDESADDAGDRDANRRYSGRVFYLGNMTVEFIRHDQVRHQYADLVAELPDRPGLIEQAFDAEVRDRRREILREMPA